MANIANFHNTSYQVAALSDKYKIWVNLRYPSREIKYKFSTHYHPYTDELIETLNRDGLPALLDAKYHKSLRQNLINWYAPGNFAVTPLPFEEIDESDDGPYSIYNWELFFHAPLTVAVHLSKNQRFAESQKWFHFIFDPTSNEVTIPAPQRFWKFLRFREETRTEFIQELLTAMSKGDDNVLKARMEKSIQAWRNKPFQPHVIARTRYLAYQLNVVMKYLDNLIAWGDNLFRQDTIESLNEATQIYVLAANILGPKPQKIPPRGKRTPKTYRQLKDIGIDAFGNALISIENDFPFNTSPTSGNGADEGATSAAFGIGRSLYFCIPQNDKLLGYWDTVADRLFKIRHCMNIEGIVRQLPLFDPPIDPGMLVKAVAAGLDVGSIVNNINQPLSTVRGPLLLQKALEICAEVKSLGAALLSALEKKDAESLSLLRQQHELNMSKLMQDVKFLQWKESEAATEALLRSRATAFERYRHYKKILGASDSDIDKLKTIELARTELSEAVFDTVYAQFIGQYANELPKEDYRKETSVGGLMEFAGNIVTGIFGGQLGKTLPLNKNENAELNIFLPTYDTFSTLSSVLKLISPIVALIPQFDAHATPLGVGAKVGFGGVQLKGLADGGADIAQKAAAAFLSSAERASKMAGYYRRAEDYVLQANVATDELMQYGRQIISSLIREQITRKEYQNHLKQIEQTEAIQAFLQDKFTNEELYTWMQGEISKIYFACYQFAYDIAKKSEQTLKYELMRKEFDDLDLIKFGYWDSARKGLLAGESLYMDLKRLEMAYHENNKREYELTKHVSVQKLDPMALLKLKATGSCEIEIPEWLYDLDSPGQFNRRIKTVAISIPCITGPFTTIHAKLSLLQSSIRVSSLKGDDYKRSGTEDTRFRDFNGAIQSMVTSTAQNDSGLFETNLRDERYLPFEGAGAISRWKIEIPNAIPQFDFETIADVVLHIRYTCREAGHLKKNATDHVKEDILKTVEGNLLQLFNIPNEFANAWQLFKSEAVVANRKLTLIVDKNNFPYWTRPLGMEDAISATFCSIDLKKNKLIVATQNLSFTGDAATGWTLTATGWALTIDNTMNPVFSFLNKALTEKRNVYMLISYLELS
jgi:Tc toxin complex TcA C-terminal TcB-binding domain